MRGVLNLLSLFSCSKIHPTECSDNRNRSKTDTEYEIALRREFSRRMDARRTKISRFRGFSV